MADEFFLSGFFRIAYITHRKFFEPCLKKYNLNYAEFFYLVFLEKFPNVNQNFIANFGEVNKSYVSTIMKRLENKNLINRKIDEVYKKNYNLSLTDDAKALLEILKEFDIDWSRKVLEIFPRESIYYQMEYFYNNQDNLLFDLSSVLNIYKYILEKDLLENKNEDLFSIYLILLYRVLKKYLNPFLEKHNISLVQYYTLYSYILKKNRPISEICDFAGIKKSFLSDILKNLENKGFIERSINPDNRRFIKVDVTDKGLETGLDIRKEERKFEELIYDSLPFTRKESQIKFFELYKLQKELVPN